MVSNVHLLAVQSVGANCVANLVVPVYFLPKLKRLHENYSCQSQIAWEKSPSSLSAIVIVLVFGGVCGMFECKRVVKVLGDIVCRGLLLRCGCGCCCRGGGSDADFDPS